MTDSRDEHETYAHTESPIIDALQKQIARLTAERDAAREERDELRGMVSKLIAERDGARREVCRMATAHHGDPQAIACERGWSCFKREDSR